MSLRVNTFTWTHHGSESWLGSTHTHSLSSPSFSDHYLFIHQKSVQGSICGLLIPSSWPSSPLIASYVITAFSLSTYLLIAINYKIFRTKLIQSVIESMRISLQLQGIQENIQIIILFIPNLMMICNYILLSWGHNFSLTLSLLLLHSLNLPLLLLFKLKKQWGRNDQ